MSFEREKIMEGLINSLKQRGIEVFEWDVLNPPHIVPRTIINCGAALEKKNKRQ
jgi:hypothetical protein